MELDFTDNKCCHRKFLTIKTTQIFLFAAILLLALVITMLCIGFLVRYEVESDVLSVDSVPYWHEKLSDEQQFWFDQGIVELKTALQVNWEPKDVRNVVIFIAYGIGIRAQAAARFQTGKKVQKLSWESFHHFGRIMNLCRNTTTTCEAPTIATSFFSGIKTTAGVVGLDSAVSTQNCTLSMNKIHQVQSIVRLAQEHNLRTGFVTTRRVSASMAALYAHAPNSTWECDAGVPPGKLLQGCKDIATQLIDDDTGGRLNVIMGGGRQVLVSNPPTSSWDPLDTNACKSKDGRNYIRDWRTMKMLKKESFALPQNEPQLKSLKGSTVDYVLGVFANGDVKPPWQRHDIENHMPELNLMVEKALDVLNRNNQGFLLIVECGNSPNDVAEQVKELLKLNETVNMASQKLSSDTLMVVVLDNGLSELNSSVDILNQTVSEDDVIKAPMHMNMFAKGPDSHFIQGIHEETYLAHVVTYALKMGQFRNR